MSSKFSLWAGLIGAVTSMLMLQPRAIADSSIEISVSARTTKVAISVDDVQDDVQSSDEYFTSAIEKENKGDYQGALADYDRSINLSASAEKYYSRGLLRYQKFDYVRGALADYDLAIVGKPDYTDAYYARGNLKYEKLQNYQGALADYDRAIQLNPDYGAIYNVRGLLKANELNDIKGGLADLNQSIQIDANNANPYNNRGFLKHEKLYDYQGALADYDRAIQIDPNFADAYRNRGNLNYQQSQRAAIVRLRQQEAAIVDMKQAAQLYKQQGNIQSYREAIESIGKWQKVK
jgi:tetratricopeptide (TPR) repeat protein